MSFLQRIFVALRGGVTRLFSFIRNLGWKRSLIGLLVIFVLVFTGKAFLGKGTDAEDAVNQVRAVEVKSVLALSSETAPLSIAGVVSSKSEATVRAESSGRVTYITHNLGDYVGAGTIVAELENGSQRAALLQAQGGEAAAQAALDKVLNGTRGEQLANLQAAETGAKDGAVNALLSSYAAVDSAVRSSADPIFSNPTSNVPHFNLETSNSGLRATTENERVSVLNILKRESASAANLSSKDDLLSELIKTTNEVRAVRDFLDHVIALLNVSISTEVYSQATISGYITAVSTARSSLNTILSSLSSARQSLETAENNLKQGVVGAQPEDVAAAQAAVTQARGAVAAARANLEKSIIRAPISGTINSFSLKQGDYVSQSSPVLTVANNGALEVIAYITENDAKEIAVGQKVGFDSGATGVVTRIAPALDPQTKKIEVRVGVTDPNKTLLNGQSVLLKIDRITPNLNSTDGIPVGARITIPIAAIKVEADRVTVFTVNPEGTLKAHVVTLGALLGDRVEILSGLTSNLNIVTDARGLRAGQTVEVK